MIKLKIQKIILKIVTKNRKWSKLAKTGKKWLKAGKKLAKNVQNSQK